MSLFVDDQDSPLIVSDEFDPLSSSATPRSKIISVEIYYVSNHKYLDDPDHVSRYGLEMAGLVYHELIAISVFL